ncbi:ribonuclease toxin immunity protein CdiI [Budviciaceae bacterium CWB-B4]|uniref:Ribonuclease toxin immunity protein CdiI n=1 Tax=Limnobaculum xujianqingii TaxID=2738837 RepID=A0A9D7FU46_9GAMM|nr:ribonuclease toxin immunity protein CdiI [Limnobaculum xujianqingii]MBK5073445.1 ribonuclease toxin immunity protein CdiI [Limnobaculum xujianqingii]MBK5176824.1 ribonuclease toxin immunity protein CdiI [Limnobaculum xujianqingii]
MRGELFNQHDVDSGLNLIVVSYFDRMYSDNRFLDVIENIIKKHGFNTDGAYCNFPDMDSYYEEEHFEGVEFAIGYPPEEDEIVIVSEEVCFKYVRLACEKYLQLHPEDTDKVNTLLAKIP